MSAIENAVPVSIARPSAQGGFVLREYARLVVTWRKAHIEIAPRLEAMSVWFGTNSPLSTDSTATQAFFLQDWPYILAAADCFSEHTFSNGRFVASFGLET